MMATMIVVLHPGGHDHHLGNLSLKSLKERMKIRLTPVSLGMALI